MTMASKNHHQHHQQQQPSSSRPPKIPTSQTNHHQQSAAAGATTLPIAISEQEKALSSATHLTRQELVKRRSHNLKQLAKCYRDHYWALMEDLKIQYREYYWKYGVSPFKEDQSQHQRLEGGGGGGGWSVDRQIGDKGGNFNVEVMGENNSGYVNNANCNYKRDLELKNNRRCSFVGCKLKAMALTSFCHLHILSDAKQKLYKPCGYVIKSAQAGPITCGKPILRSTTPSLCSVHLQKAQKHISRALKKAGLNVSTSSKLASKFHLVVAEYVHQIQVKRRAAKNENRSNGVKKEASTG